MSQSFQRFDDCFLLIAASSAERFGHKSSLIAISGVVDCAVALGGGRLRALRANFHTLHLIIEAYSEFNNSGSG